MQNRIHFLSGLPRTGSTILGSILNQNPHVYASPTSPLYSLLVNANEHFNLLNRQYTFDCQRISDKVYRSLVDAFYPPNRNKPIVFDKFRGWPKHIQAIQNYIDPEPRIICTVRPIAEILTSYITLAQQDSDNFIDTHLRSRGEPLTDEARAHLLWTDYLNVPYEATRIGLETDPECILLVDYDRLCYQPADVVHEVYNFCGMEPFEHDFDSIENTCAEAKDEAWGLKKLHTTRHKLGKTSVDPITVLPQSAIDYFNQFNLTGAFLW